MTVTETLANRALKRKLGVGVLRPEGLHRHEKSLEPWHGFLVFVQDDTGPDAFKEDTLKAMLAGAQTVICSAEMDQSHAAMIGLLLDVSLTPRIVIVVTLPRHHAAWNRKVELLSGNGPWIHIVTDEATPEDWGSAQ